MAGVGRDDGLGKGEGNGSGRSLKDELASLRIERKGSYRPQAGRRDAGGFGLRVLSALIWLIPLGLLGGAAGYGYLQYDKMRPKTEVNTAKVQSMTTGQAETLLSAKGYLRAHTQAMIGARVPGRVEQVNVEEGSKVKRGDVLAILEHNDIKAQLESRKASVLRSQADRKEAEADYLAKERKAKRWLTLQARGGIATTEDVETHVAARDMAAARLISLDAAIALQKAMVQEVEETIKNMSVIAPFDGTVVAKEANVGETITPGGMGAASGRGSVVTLANLADLEVETDIAESLLSRITVGQPAEISVSAVPGRHYRGKLFQIIPMGDRTRGTVKVKVKVLDPDDRLFPELVATVHFLPDKAIQNPDAGKSYLFLPKSAVVEEAGHTHVWVVDDKSVARKTRVEAVVTNDDLARVEAGVEAGETVVLSPPKTLRDGEIVKVAE